MANGTVEQKAAGAVMIVAAFAVLLAMAHHPSGMHGGALGGIVHGAMIGLLTILAWGFLMFATGRGAGRPLVLAGLLAYGISLFAHVGAATINGFVVPALAQPGAPPVSHDIFRLAWHSNQALATLGVAMTGAAYVLWSVDLLRSRTPSALLTGIAGLVAGLLPIVLLASGALRLDVAGAFIVYALHVAWAALIGVMLWRGALQPRAKVATSS